MSHCTCVKSVIVSFCHLGLNHENIPRQFYCHNTSNNLIYSQPRPYSYIQQQFACNIMLGIPNKPAKGLHRGAKITLDFIYFSFQKTIQASYQKLIVAYHWQSKSQLTIFWLLSINPCCQHFLIKSRI